MHAPCLCRKVSKSSSSLLQHGAISFDGRWFEQQIKYQTLILMHLAWKPRLGGKVYVSAVSGRSVKTFFWKCSKKINYCSRLWPDRVIQCGASALSTPICNSRGLATDPEGLSLRRIALSDRPNNTRSLPEMNARVIRSILEFYSSHYVMIDRSSTNIYQPYAARCKAYFGQQPARACAANTCYLPRRTMLFVYLVYTWWNASNSRISSGWSSRTHGITHFFRLSLSLLRANDNTTYRFTSSC